jgi:hypothetical protein
VKALGFFEVLVLLLFVFLLAKLIRGRSWTFVGRRPRRRRLVTRIVCGSLAALILVAVAAATYVGFGRIYAAGESASVKVHAPTGPAPEFSSIPTAPRWVPIKKARLLAHLVVVHRSHEGFTVVQAEESQVRWPEDREREIPLLLTVPGTGVRGNLTFKELYKEQAGGLIAKGRSYVWYSTPRSTGSWSGKFDVRGVDQLGRMPGASVSKTPLSVIPARAAEEHLLLFVTPVAEDDPLAEVPLSEFAGPRMETIRRQITRRKTPGLHLRVSRSAVRFGGFALAAHIGGWSGVLLLVAAVLLTQLFTNRSLAFPGMLAAAILYVAVLDRAVLSGHLSRLEEPEESLATRLTACAHMRYTFLYRRTARERLQATADDGSQPEELREFATEVELTLDTSPMGESLTYFTLHPGYRAWDPPPITDFALDDITPELVKRFPEQLSSTALGEGESGLWIACQKIDRSDAAFHRLKRVAFVRWRKGRIEQAIQVPQLVPAFASGPHVYFHWWRKLSGGYPEYIKCDSVRGWDEDSDFSFARVAAGEVDTSKLKLKTPEDYAELIDGTGGRPRHWSALQDIKVLLGKSDRSFRSVIDIR